MFRRGSASPSIANVGLTFQRDIGYVKSAKSTKKGLVLMRVAEVEILMSSEEEV